MTPNRPSSSAAPPGDDPLRPDSDAERQWLAKSAEQLRAHPAAFDAAANWQRIATRLQAERDWQQATSAHRSHRRVSWWQAVLAYGLGAATAAAVAVAIIPLQTHQAPAEVQPLGESASAVPAGEVILQVVFRDEATLGHIRALLAAQGAQVVGGPGALGVWRIAVPAARADSVRAALQKDAAVQSVAVQR